MSVKLAKNGTWLAQFRCKDKFGTKCTNASEGSRRRKRRRPGRTSSSPAQADAMEMTFGEFFKVYEADLRPRLREHT